MNLAQRRVRTMKLTLLSMFVLLLILVAFSLFSKYHEGIHPLDLLLESPAEQPQADSVASLDPLGIASKELVFERCSDDEFVLWYSASGAMAYSQALVDKALVSQGWTPCSSDAVQSCYSRYPPGSELPLYALVLFYEQADGCSIIVEVI